MPRIALTLWSIVEGNIVEGASPLLAAARQVAVLLMVGMVLTAGGLGTPVLADPLYPDLSLLMQSDAAYDAGAAGKMVTANPDDLLFRVMGPQTPNSMRKADIVNFVGSLGGWSGNLWFNVDATKKAFEKGYWGNAYSSANSYKAYVDYFAEVNQALTAAGHRAFNGIGLETEGSYLQKTSAFLGHSGSVGNYLDSKGLTTAKIAVTNSYKGAMADLDVDLQTIQAYNFDDGDPTGFATPSPASAQSLASSIAGTLAANYPEDPGILRDVVIMFSYEKIDETKFFGTDSAGSAVWDTPLFQQFLTDFKAQPHMGHTTLGVYDVGTAFVKWETNLVPEIPEPSTTLLLLPGLLVLFLGRCRE
ncbi:MAG: hypothetical protein MK161_12185 [Pirellulales bacterium]|nr:hypothetical protein [Pirellulales bacterium]